MKNITCIIIALFATLALNACGSDDRKSFEGYIPVSQETFYTYTLNGNRSIATINTKVVVNGNTQDTVLAQCSFELPINGDKSHLILRTSHPDAKDKIVYINGHHKDGKYIIEGVSLK